MLSVSVPLPPGLNQTYKTTSNSGIIYKDRKTVEWQNDAALLIGSAAGVQNFERDNWYSVVLEFKSDRMDIDAPVKVVLDTLARKLNFNDRQIISLLVTKTPIKDSTRELKITVMSHEKF